VISVIAAIAVLTVGMGVFGVLWLLALRGQSRAEAERDALMDERLNAPPRFATGGLVRPMGGSVMAGRDSVVAKLSEGRSTTRRPGETWAQAMNRLTEGEDL
jgi:hypothetical protein